MQKHDPKPSAAEERARFIFDQIPSEGLFAGGQGKVSWRISPEAFPLTEKMVAEFEALGPRLLAFYHAVNLLYRQSWHAKAPAFVAEYLDRGKPDALVKASRMNRFKQDLPRVIRPDILLPDVEEMPSKPTDSSFIITELDSVPGGMGLTGSLAQIYSRLGEEIVGGADGMVEQFAAALRSLTTKTHPRVAIVISEESASYRPEMEWLGGSLNEAGLHTTVISPEDLIVSDRGVSAPDGKNIDVIYRFFELFDLDNVAHAAELIDAAQKQRVTVTPPFKPYLEEKLLFALYQHPSLRDWWLRELGEETVAALDAVFPRTWIFDARPLPPHAVIPDLEIGGRAVTAWADLKDATQRERDLILKVSGFHPNAWGSRGVAFGRDLSAKQWSDAIDAALSEFERNPHVLQRFTKSRMVDSVWFDFQRSELVPMSGRVRLCPYYFVTRLPTDDDDGEVSLGGVLATICPPDKKLLHGMSEAIMCPCRKE